MVKVEKIQLELRSALGGLPVPYTVANNIGGILELQGSGGTNDIATIIRNNYDTISYDNSMLVANKIVRGFNNRKFVNDSMSGGAESSEGNFVCS